MCKFLSGVVLPNGDILTSTVNDSHEDIIAANNISESIAGKINIVRVEYTSETLPDIDTYQLNIDQDIIPDWFDEPMRERVADTMRGMVSRMIIKDGVHACLLGGKWIITGENTVVKKLSHGYVVLINSGLLEVCVGGTVNEVRDGGTVNRVWGGTVNEVWGGTVNRVCDGGTVNMVWGGTVNRVWGGTVNRVWGGTVNMVCDGGIVNRVRDGGTVNEVWDGGTVNKVCDGGTVNRVWGGGTVNKVCDGGKILNDYREGK